jgi:serine/threonine protein kinase
MEATVTEDASATARLLAALEPLLDEALDLAPAERAAWLADLRARTPDLAREVETLLAAEEDLDARGFLADDEHFVTMFRDEAALASKLEHPNVCRVFSLGHTDNTWFIVMEYVEGEHLIAWCNARRLGLAERLALFLEVCDAVAYAHAHRVVHRDL